VARDRVLGILTLVSTRRDRHYGPSDLAMAQQLTDRCALAIDNARLYMLAQDAVHVRDEFLSIASHELRTPLTPLQLQLDSIASTLQSSGGPDEGMLLVRVQKATKQTDRLTALVERLLEVSRISTGTLRLERQECDLGQLAQTVVRRAHRDAEIAGCTVHVRTEPAVRGMWDPTRIEQIISSLLENAIKYGAGKPIELRVKARAGTACLSIRDHGIGIDPNSSARIFERFERAVSARHYGGLGLGLFLTRELVNAHGGRISVHSEPSAGSTFTVLLPCAPAVRSESMLHVGA
jgi:signal transduction histidine kinase